MEVVMPSKLVVMLGCLGCVALFAVPAAFADQVFHTSHADAHAVAGAPLRSGFVNDMHSNGAVNSAREEYHLNGAEPNTTYRVQLVIYGNQSCSGSPVATVPTATFTTNAAGNGNAGVPFPAGQANDPPLQVGIVWQFTDNGVLAYATECVAVTAD